MAVYSVTFKILELQVINKWRPCKCGRRGGLVVSALDSVSRGPVSSPRRVICVVFLSKTQCLSTPATSQGSLTKCWGVTCDGLASYPGGVEYS